jgi:hypothetical protein
MKPKPGWNFEIAIMYSRERNYCLGGSWENLPSKDDVS